MVSRLLLRGPIFGLVACACRCLSRDRAGKGAIPEPEPAPEPGSAAPEEARPPDESADLRGGQSPELDVPHVAHPIVERERERRARLPGGRTACAGASRQHSVELLRHPAQPYPHPAQTYLHPAQTHLRPAQPASASRAVSRSSWHRYSTAKRSSGAVVLGEAPRQVTAGTWNRRVRASVVSCPGSCCPGSGAARPARQGRSRGGRGGSADLRLVVQDNRGGWTRAAIGPGSHRVRR